MARSETRPSAPEEKSGTEENRGRESILPKQWSSWQPEEVIGGHDNVTVYKAVRTDEAGTSYAAIKVLRVPQGRDKARYIEEIRMMLSLKGHPNIVTIEDYATECRNGTDLIFIRMELLTPLDRYVAANDFGEEETVRVGSDICKALEHCHKKGIIHLDIKPSNIFVSDEGYYKLGDFGISRSIDALSAKTPTEFTPNFMAPELYHLLTDKKRRIDRYKDIHKEIGPAYDLYALGLVLYWIRNNRKPPFLPDKLLTSYDRRLAFDRRMAGEELPSLKSTSAGLSDLIFKASAFDPRDRYAGAAEMRKALEKLLTRTDPPARNRLTAWILAAAALVVFGLGIYLGVQQKQKGGGATAIPSEDPTGTVTAASTSAETEASGTCGEGLRWQVTGSVLRISGEGEMDDYTSTTGSPWKDHKEAVSEVIVEEGVTKIGKYAFFDSDALETVTLPQSLRTIGNMAFGYCDVLPVLTIPEGVQVIEKSIIYRCPALRRIDLPGSLLLIEGAFAGECESLKTITLGENCTAYTVRDGALFDASMKELICHPAGINELVYTIPDTVRILGVYAFAENHNLLEVTIPESVKKIDSCAFDNCVNLKGISIPDSVTELGIYAFYGCKNLSQVRLSGKIQWLDQQAFSGCSSLEEIELPSGMDRIGNYVFSECPNLEKVIIPGSVTSIADNAFSGCVNVRIICPAGSYAEQYAVRKNLAYSSVPDASGWSDWSEKKLVPEDPDKYEEESRTVYRWWAAQCTSCGTNNPYHGSSSTCHGCGITLANDRNLWVSVFEYSETEENTQTIYGRKKGRYFNGLPYWAEGKQVTQYRYREK